MKSLSDQVKRAIADTGTQIEYAALMSFISVESGGRGFCPKTGKPMIQFEPKWFSKKSGIEISHTNSYSWDENQIEIQPAEWKAFSEAFRINPDAAMESTSIGLPQIMGFHWKRLGYPSVGDMWDDFKRSETHQIKALIKFIETDSRLLKALLEKDWHKVAMIYNGTGYAVLAHKIGREPYNISMAKAYEKFSG